uniref:C-type lectin domain-containing protein n=1 Tax=Oncorhynchus tshawytscha TaxID=74940 RepID=A0A8C8G537_ONCTS
MKSSFTGLLITALCAVVSCCLNKQFHFVNEGGKTWEKAQQYCREKYIDLAFISNQDEVDELNNISTTDYVWIGLYRDPSHPREWKWSGGWNSSFRFWEKGQPNNLNGIQNCVDVKNHEMNDKQCTEKYPFLCFDLNVVLVKENKTWEEALEHCRKHYTDLTSLLSENEQLLVQRMMNSKGAQTDHVWTGLRFLASEWLWVNGDPLEYQAWTGGRLPHCPAQHLRCGTLAREGELWGTRDCEERRNFLSNMTPISIKIRKYPP